MIDPPRSNSHRAFRRRVAAPALPAVRPSDPASRGSDQYDTLQRQFADQLTLLRAEFQEAVATYSVRVQSMLSQLGDVLVEDTGKLSAAERTARIRLLRRALDQLDHLDLKPSKGRRRDLKAVEEFAAEIGEEIAAW